MKKTTSSRLPPSTENVNPLYSYISVDPGRTREILKNILDERYEIKSERKHNVYYLRFNSRTVEALGILLREHFGINLIADQCHITVYERSDFIAPTRRGSARPGSGASTQSHITLKYNPINTDEERAIRIYYDNNWKEVLVDCREGNKDEILALLRQNPSHKEIEYCMCNLLENMHETHFAALTMDETPANTHQSTLSASAPKQKPDTDLLEKCQLLLDATINQPKIDPMLFFSSIFPLGNIMENFLSIFTPGIEQEIGQEYVNSLLSNKNYQEIRELVYNKLSDLNPTKTVLENYRSKLDACKSTNPKNRMQ